MTDFNKHEVYLEEAISRLMNLMTRAMNESSDAERQYVLDRAYDILFGIKVGLSLRN